MKHKDHLKIDEANMKLREKEMSDEVVHEWDRHGNKLRLIKNEKKDLHETQQYADDVDMWFYLTGLRLDLWLGDEIARLVEVIKMAPTCICIDTPGTVQSRPPSGGHSDYCNDWRTALKKVGHLEEE